MEAFWDIKMANRNRDEITTKGHGLGDLGGQTEDFPL